MISISKHFWIEYDMYYFKKVRKPKASFSLKLLGVMGFQLVAQSTESSEEFVLDYEEI